MGVPMDLSNNKSSKDMSGWLGIGLGAAQSAIGMIGQRAREERANKQQEKLMGMQQKNQMALNEQGRDLSMDMWNKTNYGAQMKHMKEAGLSAGLMYGGSGAGGATASSSSGGSAASGSAAQPQHMDISAIDGMRAMSEIELNKALGEKAKEEGRKAGADADVTSQYGGEEAHSRIALNFSAIGLNIAKENEADANVLVAGSNMRVNKQKISVMLSEKQLNESMAKFNESKEQVNDSVIKLNEVLGRFNEAKTMEAITNVGLNARDTARLDKLGISRQDGHVAKTVAYLSDETGLSEEQVIWGLGGVIGAEKLVGLIGDALKMRAPVRPGTVKGYGK